MNAAGQAVTLLLVEDEVDLLFVIKESLVRRGFSVLTAMTRASMKEILRDHVPDVALLDLMLPDIDGVELIRHIRSDARLAAMRIIIFSGIGDREAVARGLSAGADGFLSKPVTLQEIVDTISKVMNQPSR